MSARSTLFGQMSKTLLNSLLAESVDYTIKGGVAKTINAIVDRSDPNPKVDGTGRGGNFRPFPVNGLRLMIGSDAIKGIETVTEKFDIVRLSLKEGGATKTTFRVVKVVDQDPGMWHLEATE